MRALPGDDILRAVVRILDEGIVLHAPDSSIVAASRTAEVILGIPSSRLVGSRTLFPDVPAQGPNGAVLDAGHEPAPHALRTGAPYVARSIQFRRSSGELAWVDVQATPILAPDGAEPVGAISVLHDVTRLRTLERGRESLEPALDVRRIAPGDLVRSIRPALQRVVGDGVHLDIRMVEPIESIETDPIQFKQALFTLAVFARVSMSGVGDLQIALEDVHIGEAMPVRAVSCLKIVMTDNGAGVDPASVDRIFEPGFASMPADQRSGFGLVTVRDFVQRAGGTIEVESRVGEGTTFRLLFPRSTSRAAHVT